MPTYLIDFKNDANEEEIQAYIDSNQFSQVKIFNRLDKTYQVSADSQPLLADIISTIINDDDSHLQLLTTVEVPMISISNTVTINSGDDHNWWKLYSLRDINLDQETVDVKKFGQGINVYLVDSGIDISHPEFANRNINLLFSFTDNFSDNNGHGTGLSSLIIGNTCGLTDTTLNVVKIFDQNIPTKQSDLLSALNAILEDAAVSSNKASVVNLSWSIPKNSFIESKIQCLINAGMIVVAAAGNSGMPISEVTPASMTDVLTIGSYGQNFIPSDFSNYSNSAISCTPDLTNFGSLDSWAPGENIYIATPSNNGYSLASGTSIACAIYSGSVAYNISQYLKNTGDLPLSFFNTSNGNINFNLVNNSDRKGLLNLSDPKYSSSINKICSYAELFSSFFGNQNQMLEQMIKIIAYTNKFTSRKWLIPNMVKSYEILGDLPAGITIDGMFINIDFQNEPNSEQHVDHYVIPIRFDLRNSDISINKNIEITQIGSLFDPTSLSPDDPILQLTLEATCGTGSSRPPFCYTGFCSPPSVYTCVTLGKGCGCAAG